MVLGLIFTQSIIHFLALPLLFVLFLVVAVHFNGFRAAGVPDLS